MNQAKLRERFGIFCETMGLRPARSVTDVGGYYIRFADNDKDVSIARVVNEYGSPEDVTSFVRPAVLGDQMNFAMRIEQERSRTRKTRKGR